MKSIVDEIDAHEVVEFFSQTQNDYQCNIVSHDPREVTYLAMLDIIKNTSAGINVRELCSEACKRDKQIEYYLGHNWSLERNRKLTNHS